MKLTPQDLQAVADLLCQHYDRLPPGAEVTDLRLAMRAFAHAGHVGCRTRLDSVSWIGEVEGD